MINNTIEEPNSRKELKQITNPANQDQRNYEPSTNNLTVLLSEQNLLFTNDIAIIDEKDEFLWLKLADKGTFGTVYKVKELKTDNVYAIKRVHQDPQYVNTEYQILKELNHKNCIRIHRGYYTKDKNTNKIFLNIVMDYVPSTLYHIIHFYKKREIKFPVIIVKVYAYQLLRALLHLEKKSIVHRDLKPKNILINPKNHQLILADFGSAKIIRQGTLSISYICTRFYRAPELLLGDETYGNKIDIWAAGCVIAEMILGTPLFIGKSVSDQLLQIIKILGSPNKNYIEVLLKKKDINLPQCKGYGLMKILDGCDPLLLDLLLKMLVYNPDMRLSSLEALLHPCFDELRSDQILINEKEIVDIYDFTLEELDNNIEIFKKLVPEWYTTRVFN